MKKILLLGLVVFMAVVVFAIDIYLTQEQIDSINVSAMTWQSLLCDSEGIIKLTGSSLYTNYTCMDLEYLEEFEVYHFYTAEFRGEVPLNNILVCLQIWNVSAYHPNWCNNETGIPYCFECENCTAPQWCRRYYFNEVIAQALTNVETIKHNIRTYQTGYGGDGWGNWSSDIFGY